MVENRNIVENHKKCVEQMKKWSKKNHKMAKKWSNDEKQSKMEIWQKIIKNGRKNNRKISNPEIQQFFRISWLTFHHKREVLSKKKKLNMVIFGFVSIYLINLVFYEFCNFVLQLNAKSSKSAFSKNTQYIYFGTSCGQELNRRSSI